MSEVRNSIVWIGSVMGLPVAGTSFWLYGRLQTVCEATACAYQADVPCESGWEVSLFWIGLALVLLFCWSLDQLLKDKWPAYSRVAKHGNLHVPESD